MIPTVWLYRASSLQLVGWGVIVRPKGCRDAWPTRDPPSGTRAVFVHVGANGRCKSTVVWSRRPCNGWRTLGSRSEAYWDCWELFCHWPVSWASTVPPWGGGGNSSKLEERLTCFTLWHPSHQSSSADSSCHLY